KDFKPPEGESGHVEKDPATGEPTGILRNLTRYVKAEDPTKQPTAEDTYRRTLELFKDYNSVGLTTVCDRDASPGAIGEYAKMRDAGDLPVRLAVSHHVDTIGTVES